VRFNELEINALKCWKPDEYSFVNLARALLKIHDYKNIPNKFHGWIIANHPGTSYYEHEKYDILVAGCDEATAVVNAVEEAPASTEVKPQ
jgi:hypothetical protein